MDTITDIPMAPATEQTTVSMTAAAADVVRNLLEEKGIQGYALRVFVAGGGCSGMQYGMAFEKEPRVGDAVLQVTDGVKVVIDPQSMFYLQGAEIDYVDSLMGGGFRIENPNAVSTCGCGHSFRTEAASSASTGGGCGSGGCGGY